MSGAWDPRKRAAWMQRTRADRTRRDRAWRRANPDKARAIGRAYREKLARERPAIVVARRHRGYWNNPRVHREKARRSADLARTKLLELLGPWCGFCGEADDAVLQVDHRIPVGNRHGGVASLWQRVRRGVETPHNLHVLCANDHARKTRVESTLWRVSEAKARIHTEEEAAA